MIIWLKDSQTSARHIVKKTYTIGGKNLTFSSGKLALFADGSVTIEDETGNFLLTTAGISGARDGDFFPLSVEFQEKYYASGKIGGNRFSKREGRPSDTAVLNSRLIDRPIRPLFPKNTRSEVQIISTILSSSQKSDFGFFGISGASLALLLSGVKSYFEGPVSGVRVAVLNDETMIFDPTFDELETAILDLTVAGTCDAITMVEAGAKEVSDEIMVRAFEFAKKTIEEMCAAQLDFLVEYEKFYALPQKELIFSQLDFSFWENLENFFQKSDIDGLYNLGKTEFYEAFNALAEKISVQYQAKNPLSDEEKRFLENAIHDELKNIVKEDMRKKVLDEGIRLDGRSPDEIRPISTEISLLPRTHGSGLFERGVTQVLSVATLGGPSDIQIIDDMYEEDLKRYIHHYNFPPYSVGEVRPLRGVGRREIGHGRLAEKALEPVLPSESDFPYMIRVVSETLTCNGSSSMASVCGSSLALMDAGVPISAMVAGIAMGMIFDEKTGKYQILSDIQAQEDFLGDMDFKIARTKKGITALQMDCKIAGLSMEVVKRVFEKSKISVGHILTEMEKTIAEPKKELSPYAPFLLSIFVPEEKMREVIGKGGETIQGIEKNFDVKVDLQDDGHCTITAKNQNDGNAALDFIKNILKDIEVGDEYEGKIVKILDTVGAIVEIGKGKEGMVHISKFGVARRLANVNEVATIGQIIRVRVYKVEKDKNRIGLEKILSEAEKIAEQCLCEEKKSDLSTPNNSENSENISQKSEN